MSEHDKMDIPSAARAPGACACSAGWRLPMLLGAVLVAIVLFNGRGVRKAVDAPGPAPDTGPAVPGLTTAEVPTRQSVSLEIDFGNGRHRVFDEIAWTAGATVADILARAAQQPANDLSYAQQGSGASAFLAGIAGVANEGSGRRNWIYRVNGKRADRSFAVYELQPGDRILWTFESRNESIK